VHCYDDSTINNVVAITITKTIIEQAANLLCAQVNSASYPQRDGK